MKTISLFGFAALVAVCLPRQAMAQSAQPKSSPASSTTISLKEHPFPKDLEEFGSRTNGSIRVMVYSQVMHPGVYYLPAGAIVRDAIEGAGGLTRLNEWGYSDVLRPIDGEKAEKIRFTHKQTDLEIQLKEGDFVYLSETID